MPKKIIGYLVIDACEVHEQPLALEFGDDKPSLGVLDWTEGPRSVFSSRGEALKAINRTESYRKAFGSTHPNKKFCKIVPLTAAY